MIESKDFGALGYPPDADIGGNVSPDAGGGFDSPESELDAEIAAEMKKDSYTKETGPAHSKQVELVNRLFERRAAEGDPRSAVEKVCDDAVEQQSQKQEAGRAKAMEDFEWLAEHGFDSPCSGPPDVIPEFLADGWKQQRALAEGDYANLGIMLESSLAAAEREKVLPPGKVNAMKELIRVEDVDPALKDRVDQIAGEFIALLHDAHALKLKKGKR